MGYRSLRECVQDLEREGHLIRIDDPIDPHLEAAEIHRRVYQSGGPAILFNNVKGCRFPMVSNLFGTLERSRFMFRDTIEQVRRAIELKIDPSRLAKNPARYWKAPLTAWSMQPKRVSSGPVLKNQCKISELPAMKSWPDDGGPFVTLPQVYSEDVRQAGLMHSNLGMYRVQLSGNEYETDREVGLHYQIHRGIGVHHQAARAAGRPFRVNVFVGGSPAMMLAAVMPLPEGMSELTFAGALAGQRIKMAGSKQDLPVYAQADFAICGTVPADQTKPEGPFGDHLGYYSLIHPFPFLQVEKVVHRDDAIWPFTVVGRPPQEDTSFGELIHDLTGPIIPTVLPGVREVHAVDASGVHPLLLAIGSERYTPYVNVQRPMELLTQANAILGQGQMSLAKYLFIVNGQDDNELRCDDIGRFFQHLLQRADWTNDLHFHTRTTIDTLDYSGEGFNEGSKLVIAAQGEPRFPLATELPANLPLPDQWSQPKIALPGILVVQAPAAKGEPRNGSQLRNWCQSIPVDGPLNQFRMIVIVDDSDMASRTLNNFLWVTFTRSNPAADIDGVGAFTETRHWGCRGALVIDARIRDWHAPPLIEDAEVTALVDARAARGGPLARYL